MIPSTIIWKIWNLGVNWLLLGCGGRWLRAPGSNGHYRVQSLASYRLDEPAARRLGVVPDRAPGGAHLPHVGGGEGGEGAVLAEGVGHVDLGGGVSLERG